MSDKHAGEVRISMTTAELRELLDLRAENERLRKALEFYADMGGYYDLSASVIWDRGATAREALRTVERLASASTDYTRPTAPRGEKYNASLDDLTKIAFDQGVEIRKVAEQIEMLIGALEDIRSFLDDGHDKLQYDPNAGKYDLLGDYETDARYIYPARERWIREQLDAVIAAVRKM